MEGRVARFKFADAAATKSAPVQVYAYSRFAFGFEGEGLTENGYVELEAAEGQDDEFRPLMLSSGGAIRLQVPAAGAVVGLTQDEAAAAAPVRWLRIDRSGLNYTGNPDIYLHAK